MSMFVEYWPIFVLIVFVVLFGTVIIVAISTSPSPIEKEPPQVEINHGKLYPSDEISVIHVKGMPCVVFRGFEKGGVTCDWTKWDYE